MATCTPNKSRPGTQKTENVSAVQTTVAFGSENGTTAALPGGRVSDVVAWYCRL